MHVTRYRDAVRTTLSIDDRLLNRAKHRARQCGVTLGEFVEGSLRRELATAEEQPQPPEVPVFNGDSPPEPDIDLRSGREIADLFDDEDLNRSGVRDR